MPRRRTFNEVESKLTPLGSLMLAAMEQKHLYMQNFIEQVGLKYVGRLDYLLYSSNAHLPIHLLFSIANTLDLSPLKLLLLCYQGQQTTKELSNERKYLECCFMTLFDRFFRMRPVEQDTLIYLCESQASKRKEPPAYCGLHEFLYKSSSSPLLQKGIVSLKDVVDPQFKLLADKEIYKGAIAEKLGVWRGYLFNLIHNDTFGIFLPILFRLADLLDISYLRVFLLIYLRLDSDARLADNIVILEKKYAQLFDNFLLLDPQQQESTIILSNVMLSQYGQRDMSEAQQSFIDSIPRVQPLKGNNKNPTYTQKKKRRLEIEMAREVSTNGRD